ncbi:MAG: ATP-dependent DNA ligase [Candidatus Bathyarchaeota archaeon]|nr:MAG: ATP-dependent DNA ligase [Candidatus Bathyarchaeota archaeon]
MQTRFRALAELCERLEATSKRTLMVDLVADFLRRLNVDEVEPATSMILGRAFPRWDRRTLEVSWNTLSRVIKRLTNMGWKGFSEAFNETGDIGSAIRIVFEATKIQKQATLLDKPLTILEVRRSLETIAEATGVGSREQKERLLETLLGSATPLEVKYIVRVSIGEMRTGFYEGLMELAVSKAFDVPPDVVQTATMLTGDVGEVAATAKVEGKKGVKQIRFRVFRAVKPMLAQTAQDVGEALSEHGGETAFEHKLDGARIQIHKLGDSIRIFSRRLTDITQSLPEIVELVRNEVTVQEAILEGEVIAVGKNGIPLPFQHLMRRFRRVHDIETMTKQIPVDLHLFDLIYLNGQSMTTTPYVDRREKLKQIVGSLSLTKQITTSDLQEAKKFLKEALDSGHEGLVAKKLDSLYTPGVRGKRWFKIKTSLEPLDLVIVAAEYGYGRRHRWLSDYYLADREVETGEFLVVGKTFKGLTDEEMTEMTKRLKELVVAEEHRRVVVAPQIVVEVAYNEVQKSSRYECGMALRFARITRIRPDKSPEEADTIQRVREIYKTQFTAKGRYKQFLGDT